MQYVLEKLQTNRLYLAEKIETVIKALLDRIQITDLLQFKDIKKLRNNYCPEIPPGLKTNISLNYPACANPSSPPTSPTSNTLLDLLNIRDQESFQVFIDCLRNVKLVRAADLLERDGGEVSVC